MAKDSKKAATKAEKDKDPVNETTAVNKTADADELTEKVITALSS